jgi:cyclopropane fatty-acyl-phospholipid synthase-like methyltransferase
MSDLYTFVGHKSLAFANPFGEASMQRAVEVLGLGPGALVADFGAGSCELPIRLVERYKARVAAVELSARMAAVAREKIHARLVVKELPGGVTVHEGDAGAFRATMEPQSFDLTVCIGSTHARGGYEKTLQVLKRLTRPGGQVLVGEGFWAKAPPEAYLQATGMAADEFHTHGANIDHAAKEGLRPLWSITASEREWDEYEWALNRNFESLASKECEKCDSSAALLARSRGWRESYWRWGRSVLGFGLYLFRV